MKITKELLDYLAANTGVRQKDLLEKDALLHLLLRELAGDERFRTHYVFKGGTCLTKCYLGYYRFSEDLDFTWVDQQAFAGKTEKQVRKQLSEEIKVLGGLLEAAVGKLGLDFRLDKRDRRYVELGGGNRFATFKLWYKSVELSVWQFIKIQINYVEEFAYNFKKLPAKNILSGMDAREFRFLYPHAAENLLESPTVLAYDLREILAEKVRAVLTRRGVKARDFIDVHVIQKHAGIRVRDIEAQITRKTRFMLKYEKYQRNLEQKAKHKPSFKLGDEEKLLLKSIDPGFMESTEDFKGFLNKLANQLLEDNPLSCQ